MDIHERLQSLVKGDHQSLDAFLRRVCVSEQVNDTKAHMHVHMLRLDGNNRPRINDFANYLINQIVDYCIPLSEIHKAQEKDRTGNTSQYSAALYRKAERLFTDLEKTGEVGELALFVIAQNILQIPQVLCKMVLKTNPQVHFHGADGIYGKYDEQTEKYCLYWGEAKVYADIGQALNDCFDSIKELLVGEGVDGTRRERDMDLFRSNLDFDDPHLENAILEFLDPENAQYLMLEYRGICFIGYNEENYPKDCSIIENEIFEAVKNKVSSFKEKIATRLKSRNPLDSFILEVFLVPFSDVNAFRDRFLKLL